MIENVKNRTIYIAAFLLYLGIFILSISVNVSISHDSIFYVLGAQNNEWLFHPHHLLYHVFTQLIVNTSQWAGISNDIPFLMSAASSLFGALMMVYILKIFIELFDLKKSLALAASGVIAFSYGVWYYSACIEVYIIPLFFVILSYYTFFKHEGKHYYVGLYAGLATLFHQMYIFLLIIYVIAYLFRKDKLKDIVKFAASYSLVVGVVYIAVLIFDYKVSSVSEAISQLTLYAHEMPEMWSSFGLSIVINDLIGLGRSIFSIHYLYSFDAIQSIVSQKFPNNSFNEEIFLVRNISAFMQVFLSVLLFAMIVLFFRFLVVSIKNMIRQKEHKLYKVWYLTFLVIFVLFFTFWSSNNPEFWISIYTITIISFMRFVDKSKKELLALTAMFALLMAYNYFSTIQFAKHIENDYYLERIHSISDIVQPKDVIVYDQSYMVGDYFAYKGYRNLLAAGKLGSDEILHKIDSLQSANLQSNIFFVDEIFNSDAKISDNYKKFKQEIGERELIEPIEVNDYKIYELIIKNK